MTETPVKSAREPGEKESIVKSAVPPTLMEAPSDCPVELLFSISILNDRTKDTDRGSYY